jgi:hypothetical protein
LFLSMPALLVCPHHVAAATSVATDNPLLHRFCIRMPLCHQAYCGQTTWLSFSDSCCNQAMYLHVGRCFSTYCVCAAYAGLCTLLRMQLRVQISGYSSCGCAQACRYGPRLMLLPWQHSSLQQQGREESARRNLSGQTRRGNEQQPT